MKRLLALLFIVYGSSFIALNAQTCDPLIHSVQVREPDINFKNELANAREILSKRTPASSSFITKDNRLIIHYAAALNDSSKWTGGSRPSCIYPSFFTDSILITIPAGITVTYFTIDYAYRSSTLITNQVPINDGIFQLYTSCGTTDTVSCMHETGGGHGDTAGICFLVPYEDFHNPLTCCFPPSCSPQSFWLYAALSRRNGGLGCDTSTIWYTQGFYTGFQYYFSAYLEGYTDSLSSWSINPSTLSSDSCNFQLTATVIDGVPPYTISHLWDSASPVSFGSDTGCTSSGTVTLNLIIPGCPFADSTNDTIVMPPPIVLDACSDTVKGFTSKKIILKAVTGIKEINKSENSISVYPNPNNGKFVLQSSVVSSHWSVEIFDVLGEKVYSQSKIQHSASNINLGSQPSGVYFYRAIDETGKEIGRGKVIIQR